MFNKSKKAFSLVELLVVITILVILWVIWVSINDWYKQKTYNTKVATDLSTIENALIRFKQENSFIPSPEWNLKYFTSDWSYAHDETEAYGFHWFITEKTISKKYINVFPKDPKSNQYYAYGKTISWWFFEVAWVVEYWDKYESITKWNYIWKTSIYNLIREYNWPDFVYDKSKNNFPYNPEEMILTAKISSFTGDLTLNNTITDKNTILERQLISWDNIKLSTWSTAIIYYSDWTVSYLWDNETPLELTLSVMKYKKDDNLFTKIRLALNFWTILTKASKMATESNFDIYTTDTEASVRWTIFEIKRIEWENKTHIKVIKWSIFLNGINVSSYEELLETFDKDQEISPKYPINTLIPDYTEIVLVLWHQESILKEWGEITIDWTTDIPQPIIINPDECKLDEHMESTGCKTNIETCDMKDLWWNKIWEWNKSWNITWGDCKAVSCIDGYEKIWDECVKINICDLNYTWDTSSNTCIANTKTVNCSWISPNYSYKTTWDNYTQTWNWSIWTPTKNRWYNQTVCGFRCNTNYTRNTSTNSCVANTKTVSCGWVIPVNAINTTLTTYTQTWNWSARTPIKNRWYNQTVCGFNCKTNYTWNTSTNSCVANTKTVSCGWVIPVNAINTTLTTYTQTWNWSARTPTKNRWYNQTVCGFNCKTNYTWNTSTNSCVANTKTVSCGWTFPSHALRITATTYIQTWNWSVRTPTKNRWYDQIVCGFRCNIDYSRIWGICKANTVNVSWYWCEQCPAWFGWEERFDSCWLFWNRYLWRCLNVKDTFWNNVICKKEESWSWSNSNCNDTENIPWSWTYTQ